MEIFWRPLPIYRYKAGLSDTQIQRHFHRVDMTGAAMLTMTGIKLNGKLGPSPLKKNLSFLHLGLSFILARERHKSAAADFRSNSSTDYNIQSFFNVSAIRIPGILFRFN